MTTHSLKRRRPVTACLECYRRKQKCNRVKPVCNICLSRNIPEKCSYEDEVDSLRSKSKLDHSPNTDTAVLVKQTNGEHDLSQPERSLDEQIGYSKININNTYAGLQKALKSPTARGLTPPSIPVSALQACFQDRYLELVAQLPSEAICLDLIELYFIEADWYFHAMDRYYFMQHFVAWMKLDINSSKHKNLPSLSRDLHYFPALLFQLLAVALHFLRENSSSASNLHLGSVADFNKLSEVFSRLALEIMTMLGRLKPAVTAVEYDLMRATWLKNCSRGSEAWHSVGNAIRLAQELGLHMQGDIPQSPNQNLEENLNYIWHDQYRRRVWARLFILDSHMALILGRPRHINKDDCTVSPPDDRDMPGSPFKIGPLPPASQQYPPSNTYIIFLYTVGLKIHDMLSCGANKPHIRDYSQVTRLDTEIRNVLADLPPAMRPQNPNTAWDELKPQFPKLRQQIVSTSNAYLMNLHRAHMAVHDQSREAATLAALNVLESQQRLFELLPENQYRIHGFSFYTIDAGMFLSARTIDHPPKDLDLLQQIRRALQQAITRLQGLKDTSAVANLGERTLRHCYQQIHEISMTAAHSVQQAVSDHGFWSDMPLYDMEGFDPTDPQQLKLQAVPNLFDAGITTGYDPTQLMASDMFSFGASEQDYFLFSLGQSLSTNTGTTMADQPWNSL